MFSISLNLLLKLSSVKVSGLGKSAVANSPNASVEVKSVFWRFNYPNEFLAEFATFVSSICKFAVICLAAPAL